MKEFIFPEMSCPVCDAQLDVATGADDRSPVPGGCYFVCGYCASFLQLTTNCDLQLLTLEQIGALEDCERIELQRARRMILSRSA